MVGNLQGSVKAVDLNSMRIITRDKFTLLPMPPSVIEYFNKIAANQKRKLSLDPIFRFGNQNSEVNINEDLVDEEISKEHRGLLGIDTIAVPEEDRENFDVHHALMLISLNKAFRKPIIMHQCKNLRQ
jgi:hypothetical protein